jgi:hypothetical protein
MKKSVIKEYASKTRRESRKARRYIILYFEVYTNDLHFSVCVFIFHRSLRSEGQTIHGSNYLVIFEQLAMHVRCKIRA